MRHAANLCECPPAKWRLAFRHSIAQLEELRASVQSRIPEGIFRSQDLHAGLACVLYMWRVFMSGGRGAACLSFQPLRLLQHEVPIGVESQHPGKCAAGLQETRVVLASWVTFRKVAVACTL